MHACEMHACEMHAYEVHAREVHAYEMVLKASVACIFDKLVMVICIRPTVRSTEVGSIIRYQY
jgi:hypothetical protein